MRKKKEPRRTGIRFGSNGKGYFRMKHITKAARTSSFVACAALWIGLAFLPAERPALADGAGEPETVFFSLAWGILFFGEAVSGWIIAGTLLFVAGIVSMQMKTANARSGS